MAEHTNARTNYLNFDKSRMVNLEYSLDREILRTNRRGAYHCTSIAECNTRKQHGLLVVPVPRFGNTNHVLLSSCGETIIQHGAEFNMGVNKYDGNHFSPQGHKYIREFSCDIIPKIVYRVGGVVFSKEKMFSLEKNTIYIRYTLLDAHSATTIRFNPFLAFREINQLTQENSTADHGYKEVENGISMCMYSGYPNLYMQFSKSDIKFEFNPKWHKGVEYIRDMEEGLPYKEDLYVPGYFEMPIKKGEVIIFAASDTPIEDVNNLPNLFTKGIERRTPRSSFYNCLKNSAQQFYYRPAENETYILNGYPWGKVTAREQFMALDGLTMSIGKNDVCESILDTSIPVVRAFMQEKQIDTPIKGIDEPDVLLWFLRCLKRFSDVKPDIFENKYKELVPEIVDYILANKHPRIKVSGNMLLHTDGRYQPASWMNAMKDGVPMVPRTGYLVEVNAFWYNALRFGQDLSSTQKNSAYSEKLERIADKVKDSFLETFVNNSGYLFDFVDGYNADWTVRPNMLYAISSNYPLLDKRASKIALDFVTRELLMSKGLRTKSPQSGGFAPRYEGTCEDKAYASYNGMARTWLIAPYLEAYLKVFNRSGLSFLERVLAGIEEEMSNNCIGSLSEMYDGNMPSLGHGAVSSSAAVAGVLRALKMRNTFAEQY